MRECKIDIACHQILNYIPIIKGMAMNIEKLIDEDAGAGEMLEITGKMKHRCNNLMEIFKDSLDGTTPPPRSTALAVAKAFLGTPYIWGGDDPSGFDCSGFVIEVLKSVGVLPRNGDWTADRLYMDQFRGLDISAPVCGALVFWFNNDLKAVHVEICLDTVLAIGASGGGSGTRTPADAWKQNAYIKIRPIASRPGHRRYVDPF